MFSVYYVVAIESSNRRLMRVSSADEFYQAMGPITQEFLEDKILNADQLIKVSLIHYF